VRKPEGKGWSVARGQKPGAAATATIDREVFGMKRNKHRVGYREDEDLYVYDQSS
jgi:polyisoprenoid-binding protein YceI